MTHRLSLPETKDKIGIYEALLPQVESLFQGEPDLIANMVNLVAVLKEAFQHLWIGFYLVKNDELVLGPFQGSLACTRIGFGKGVCGSSWKNMKTIIVPDVDKFPGHIACSSESKSEIVVPGIRKGRVSFVLDIDSHLLNTFDATDARYLGLLVDHLLKYSES
ncbi:MAG: GAF domain-containing protein [Cyclobacteriaceae bacterium]|nr:GAF domain-containing protein [Cyclobacteriaceae bacterium]